LVSVSIAQFPAHAALEVDLSAGTDLPPAVVVLGSALGVVEVTWQPPRAWHRVEAAVVVACELVLQSPTPQDVDAPCVPYLVAVRQPPLIAHDAAAVVLPEPDLALQPDTPIRPMQVS